MRYCFVKPTLTSKGIGQITPCIHVIRPDFQSLDVVFDCLVHLAPGVKKVRQIVMHISVVRVGFQNVEVVFDGLVEFAGGVS